MIDFQNGQYIKLAPWSPSEAHGQLKALLARDEKLYLAFRGVRDSVTFTDKRIITLNVQGLTGKKRDFTSLPYSRIQAFSVETAGTFDLDSELDLWFSGMGMIRLEFSRGVDVTTIARLIADHAL